MGAALTTSNLDTNGLPGWHVGLMCLASATIGTVFPIQGCCNGVLVKHILNPFRAVSLTFGIAACLLASITVLWCFIVGETFTLNFEPGDIWMFCGGLCGGALVTCNCVGIPILGAAAFTTVFLATQLVTAVMCDSLGAFNFASKEVSPQRLVGVFIAIMGAGLYQFNVTFCPNYSPPVPPPNQPPKRASLRAVQGAASAARSSIKFTADEDAPEQATKEEKSMHSKRVSLRVGAS